MNSQDDFLESTLSLLCIRILGFTSFRSPQIKKKAHFLLSFPFFETAWKIEVNRQDCQLPRFREKIDGFWEGSRDILPKREGKIVTTHADETLAVGV